MVAVPGGIVVGLVVDELCVGGRIVLAHVDRVHRCGVAAVIGEGLSAFEPKHFPVRVRDRV